MEDSDKKLQAEWIVAQSILGELITNDFSYDSWEKKKDNGLLNGRISWETWKRYYTKNKESVISQLKYSTEYKDFNGSIIRFGEREKILKDTGGRSMTNLCEDVAK